MSKVIAHELEIFGSHGMQAHRYEALFALLEAGKLPLEALIGKTIRLEQSIDALVNMDKSLTQSYHALSSGCAFGTIPVSY